MYMLPEISTAMENGSIAALVAGPPSPVVPFIPDPAMVVMMPVLLATVRTLKLLSGSAM
jgi:hypothetical protein